MAIIPDAVPENALDYEEIFRRGGANCGDEDFALCKCPHCNHIYLVEYEVDTMYLDASDLSRRIPLNLGVWTYECENCGGEFPREVWIGADSPEPMQVTWQDLKASPWFWITARTREDNIEGQ